MTTRSANEIWTQTVTGEWRPVGVLSKLMDTIAVWHQRASERRTLASLDDRSLQDTGLTTSDVAMEWGKPFWRE